MISFSTKKKIMVISDRREKAKRLKEELEKRQVCDVVDIYTANPNKLLEELIINKGKEQYDYRMFIIEESTDLDFLLCEHLWRNFPMAHLVLWVKGFERPKTPDQIRSNLFASHYKKGMTFQQCLEAYKKYRRISDDRWRKEFESDKSAYQREMNECERAINFERYFYGTNYIIEPYRGEMNYGKMIGKLKHIMVTGIYDGRAPKVYPSPEEERKAKSKKAYEKILSSQASGWTTTFFKSALRQYGNDITEIEYAKDIVKRLRSYERDAKQELESIQKHIRDFQDRFPSIVEDPTTAFEVASSTSSQEKKKEEK
jgi:hypothetical protein